MATEDALLYTFSTIAQALGRMFALLAAFVLYRPQSFESMMDSGVDRWRLAAQIQSFTP